MKEITRGNFRILLSAFIEDNNLTIEKTARAITCSGSSLYRILAGKTLPSDEMIKQTGIMIEIGFKSYSKLSKAQKEKISESIGIIGGGVLGFASITAVVSSLGIAGLSAAGISSGLAALGAIVGGGMAIGITVAAAIPVAAGALGYAIIRSVKFFVEESVLNEEKYDPSWELSLKSKNNKMKSNPRLI